MDSDQHAFDKDAVAALAIQAKAALRKRARGVRNAIPKAAIAERSRAICARLLAHPALAAPATVASFHPIEGRNEVDLRALDAALRARGARVVYPAIDPETRVMVFRDPGDPARLEERGMGFCEPDPSLPEVTSIDVVIVPALAVDGRGHRLGYGAGFYDRALPRFCPPGTSIIVAFEFQLASELPISETDVAADWIVTDKATLNPAAPAPSVAARDVRR